MSVYVRDSGYTGERFIKIRDCTPHLVLKFSQGVGGGKANNGHYDGSVLPPTEKDFFREKLTRYLGIGQPTVESEHTLVLWNCRSKREPVKREYLRNIMLLENASLGLINETFMIKEDRLFVRDFRNYRADNTVRRRGVAVLVRKQLDAKTEIIEKDKGGIYIKISLTDPVTRHSRTFATCNGGFDVNENFSVPEHVLCSDLVTGDMNSHASGLLRKGVYHHSSNLRFVGEIQVPTNMSDHNVLIFAFDAPF